MNQRVQRIMLQSIVGMLRPLVRLALHLGIPFQVMSEMLKEQYVMVANDEMATGAAKQTKSRVSLLTGLSRKEVLRVLSDESVMITTPLERHNRLARVINGWCADPRFLDPTTGTPRALSINSGSHSFSDLVKAFSGDVPVRAVLDELRQLGAVSVTEGDTKAVPLTNSYVDLIPNREFVMALVDKGASIMNGLVQNVVGDGVGEAASGSNAMELEDIDRRFAHLLMDVAMMIGATQPAAEGKPNLMVDKLQREGRMVESPETGMGLCYYCLPDDEDAVPKPESA